jgi:pyrimidine-nucleoside phosphorylase/thymidine phosphorylase
VEAAVRAVDLIRRKRDDGVLSPDEIRFLVAGVTSGAVPEYQWAALLMAIVWRGMNAAETEALVDAMLHSGTVIDLSDIPGPKVDKHSTGGVADTTSLILAPVVAACGVTVPMVSGRGLGHTGGTLDKLESIPGFRVDLDLDAYRRVAGECGLVLAGQTAEIAPADRVLYALRDATATVESIPLITASILSKKLAEGIDSLVLDVKCGDGAFMTRPEDARALATSLATIGRGLGTPVRALLTSMDEPLGPAVGNALEVREAIACLRGAGDASLTELSLELAAEMLLVSGAAADIEEARARCRRAVADGSALERFRRVVIAQGGDGRVCDAPDTVLPRAARVEAVHADRGGFVTATRALPIGQASMLLGAGRSTVDSSIDPAAGIVIRKRMGDTVRDGDVLAELHVSAEHAHSLTVAREMLLRAFRIEAEPVPRPPLVLGRL